MARGDHIFVQRMGGLYSHHGIDRGDGRVIHYWGGETWRPPRVVCSEIEQFAGDVPVKTRSYADVAALLEARTADLLGSLAVARWSQEWNRALDRLRGLPEGPFDLSADAVLERAESRLGEGQFDFVINNCEHFATWCKTGVSESSQVESLWRVAMGPLAYWQHQAETLTRRLFRGDGIP